MDRIPEKEIKIIIKVTYILLLFLALFLLYYYLFPAAINLIKVTIPLILPFLIAIIIVGLLEPVVSFCEKKLKINRTVSVLLTLLMFIALIIGIFVWLISKLIIELVNFSNEFPKYASNINDTIISLAYELEDLLITVNFSPQMMEAIEDSISSVLTAVRQLSLYLLNSFFNLVSHLPMVLIILLFVFLAVFFFSRDKDLFIKTFEKHLPAFIYKRLMIVSTETGAAVFGFIRAQIILMFFTAGFAFIGLEILGVTYALLAAVLVGIADIMPIIGPGAVFVPWVIWEVLNGNFGFAVILFILYTIISVTRQILQPKVVGESIGLHPVEALMALFIGLRLLGVIGFILGPIIWVVVKVSWKSGVFSRNFKI